MTLLTDYTRRYPSPEQAITAFVADMEAKYARQPTVATASDRWVQCDWTIEYQKAGEKTGVALALLFGLVGHFAFAVAKRKFSTFHRLTTKESGVLRTSLGLRRAVLPFVTFGTVLIGFLFIYFIIGAACFLPTAKVPITAGSVARLAGLFFAALLIFLGAIKIQKAVGRMGRPPHTTEFADQRIKLAAVREV